MLENLENLCSLNGVSGDEESVREFIIKNIENHCTYTVDPLGSIIAFKKGKKTPQKQVMICAHMDEVGFIVTGITDGGYLKFSPVGGIDPRTVFGTAVVVGNSVGGVIGGKAMHQVSAGDKDNAPQFSDMFIDIGASSKEQAQEKVQLGDFVAFSSEFEKFGNNKIVSKAIDDRAGCAIMLDIIKSELEYDTYFVFNVQEEVGLRGSKASAFTVDADVAVVLEATTAADLSGVSGSERVCCLGEGAVVSFMDHSTIYDKKLYNLAFSLAKENDIKIQTKTAVAGGNDSGAIHLTKNGVRTVAVSVPCRYIHSPSCVADIADIYSSRDLVLKLLEKIYD